MKKRERKIVVEMWEIVKKREKEIGVELFNRFLEEKKEYKKRLQSLRGIEMQEIRIRKKLDEKDKNVMYQMKCEIDKMEDKM